jgi:cell wall-associated NlpC family hydrolase
MSRSHWWTDYIGVPFLDRGRTRNGCDCYGLVHIVYLSELRLALPSYEGTYATVKDAAAVQAAWARFSSFWRRIEDPEPFSVALFEFSNGRLHCGVMIDSRRMLHVEEGKDACVQTFEHLRNQFRGYYVPA